MCVCVCVCVCACVLPSFSLTGGEEASNTSVEIATNYVL